MTVHAPFTKSFYMLSWLVAVVGCSGGPVENTTQERIFPAELIDAAWPLKTTDAEMQTVYFADPWVKHTVKRKYCDGISALGTKEGAALARMHADVSAVYRQAALVSTRSLIQTYSETPQETDPDGVSHLLAASFAVEGDWEKAKVYSAKSLALEDVPAEWVTPWSTLISPATEETNLVLDWSELPTNLGPVTAGSCPELAGLPHYSLKEKGDSGYSVDMGDPGALVALAMWHEAAAVMAAPEQKDAILTYGARYRLPSEPDVSKPVALDTPFLMGSDYGVSGDAVFMAELLSSKGTQALESHQATSLVAFLYTRATKNGTFDSLEALDLSKALRNEVLSAMEKKSGKADRFHRPYTKILITGTLRNLALVAQHLGDKEASGILRMNAKDMSEDASAAPEGLLSLAAWDAGNRYPSRGLEIIHQQVKRYPSLEVARYGLDVFAVRVGRERVGMPGM